MIDLSDEALFDRIGDVLLEIPELARSIRIFEMQMRAVDTQRAFEFTIDWATVSHRELPVTAMLTRQRSRIISSSL